MLGKRSIQTQLTVYIILLLVITVGSVLAVTILAQHRAVLGQNRERGNTLIGSVNTTIDTVSPMIIDLQDIAELNGRLTRLVDQYQDIDFIAVAWPDGRVLFHSSPAYQGQTDATLTDLPTGKTVRREVTGFDLVYLTTRSFDNPTKVGPAQYNVIVGADAQAIDKRLLAADIPAVLLMIGLIIVVALVVRFILQRRVGVPLGQLSEAVRAFGAGQLDYQVSASGSRELRELGTTLNQMAVDLKASRAAVEEANRTLEQRVAERTRDIAIVTQVSAQTSDILDIPHLLRSISDLTKENFGLYHAHVYVLDEGSATLTLAGGAGETGQFLVAAGHRIPLAHPHSLVAQAARRRGVVVADDVRQVPDFLPNPLLPETRAELAVALVAHNQLLGVLDVQSEVVGRFDRDIQAVMETLARQVAAALSNAQFYAISEQTSRYERALSTITEQIQGAVSIDEVLQVTARELGQTLRVPRTAIALHIGSTPDPQHPVDDPHAGSLEPAHS